MYALCRIVNGPADEVDHYGNQSPVTIRTGSTSDMVRIRTAGLQLARLADLPKDVLTYAGQIAHRLGDESRQKQESSESCRVAKRRKAVLRVRSATYCFRIVDL
jgi:hypothetical protein